MIKAISVSFYILSTFMVISSYILKFDMFGIIVTSLSSSVAIAIGITVSRYYINNTKHIRK